jgi:hypothetical protein
MFLSLVFFLYFSVVDRHRFMSIHFHVDAGPDPDRDWHQNDPDPHADPAPNFTHVGKYGQKIHF